MNSWTRNIFVIPSTLYNAWVFLKKMEDELMSHFSFQFSLIFLFWALWTWFPWVNMGAWWHFTVLAHLLDNFQVYSDKTENPSRPLAQWSFSTTFILGTFVWILSDVVYMFPFKKNQNMTVLNISWNWGYFVQLFQLLLFNNVLLHLYENIEMVGTTWQVAERDELCV